MAAAVERGLSAEGVLPGELRLPRKARSYLLKARRSGEPFRRTGLLAAFALAVAEENAAGHVVVTAPTCGSSGVLPATLRYLQETLGSSREEVLRALATAGLVGNVVKANASISGAEVGCQGEIGTACAMAAAAAAALMGATPRQVEYAAEMGLEHHLGLTCDPVAGLVQIPCIERNAFAASRALDCAEYALLSDGTHRVSFDQVTQVMKQTGKDLLSKYRETAAGGLALVGR
jgi:L-serine dehydratase